MESMRLLILICLILTQIKSFDTSKKVEEALTCKKVEQKEYQDELYVLNQILPRTKFRINLLKGRLASLERQAEQITGDQNEKKQKRKTLKLAWIDIYHSETSVAANTRFARVKEIYHQAQFIGSYAVLELVQKRQPDFRKDSEIARVKAYCHKWNEKKKNLEIRRLLKEAELKITEKKQKKVKLEADLIKAERKMNYGDLYMYDYMYKSMLLRNEIKKLDLEINSIEAQIPSLEIELEEEGFKQYYDLPAIKFDVLFNEMVSIVVGDKYKDWRDLIAEANSIRVKKLEAKLASLSFSYDLEKIKTQIKFYASALKRNNRDELAKKELIELSLTRIKLESEEENNREAVVEKRESYKEIREEMERRCNSTDYEVSEENFSNDKLKVINRLVSNIFEKSCLTERLSEIYIVENEKEREVKREIDLLKDHLNLLHELKTNYDTLLIDIADDLRSAEQIVLEKTPVKQNLERRLQVIETEISVLEGEIQALKLSEQLLPLNFALLDKNIVRPKVFEAETNGLEEKIFAFDRSGHEESKIINAVLIESDTPEIVAPASGLYWYKKRYQRTTKTKNDRI